VEHVPPSAIHSFNNKVTNDKPKDAVGTKIALEPHIASYEQICRLPCQTANRHSSLGWQGHQEFLFQACSRIGHEKNLCLSAHRPEMLPLGRLRIPCGVSLVTCITWKTLYSWHATLSRAEQNSIKLDSCDWKERSEDQSGIATLKVNFCRTGNAPFFGAIPAYTHPNPNCNRRGPTAHSSHGKNNCPATDSVYVSINFKTFSPNRCVQRYRLDIKKMCEKCLSKKETCCNAFILLLARILATVDKERELWFNTPG